MLRASYRACRRAANRASASYELLGWVVVFSAGFHTSVGVMLAVLGGMVV